MAASSVFRQAGGTGARRINLTAPQPAETLSKPAGLDGPWAVFAPSAWVSGLTGTAGAVRRTAQVDLTVL